MNPADLSPAERRERGAELCRRLAADVASVAPAGLGGWPQTWKRVAPADAAFLERLTAWEAAPSEAARLKVRDAYLAVVEAWRSAAELYQRERAQR